MPDHQVGTSLVRRRWARTCGLSKSHEPRAPADGARIQGRRQRCDARRRSDVGHRRRGPSRKRRQSPRLATIGRAYPRNVAVAFLPMFVAAGRVEDLVHHRAEEVAPAATKKPDDEHERRHEHANAHGDGAKHSWSFTALRHLRNLTARARNTQPADHFAGSLGGVAAGASVVAFTAIDSISVRARSAWVTRSATAFRARSSA